MRPRPAPSRLRTAVVPRLAGAVAVVLAAGLALATGGTIFAGCHRQPGPPKHVFLVTVDTLRADHTSVYRYVRDTTPTIARFAAEGVVFDDAISQWPKTGPSFASMFTGRYPQTTGLTHDADVPLPAEYLSLAELMKAAGYATAAVVSNGVLPKRHGWDQGFDDFEEVWRLSGRDDVADPVEYRTYINALRVNELALPLLDRHKDDERLFVWLHYSDPHAPYTLPAGETNPFLGDAHDIGDREADFSDPRALVLDGHRDLKWYVAQYDANVRLVDREIARVLDRAKALGMLDDALVVFTADHGEGLGENGAWFEHGRVPHQPGLHVPLVVWRPGVFAPRRVSQPVELVDLYPTLRELAAPTHEVPGLEGSSLAPLLRGEPAAPGPHYAFSEAGGGTPLTHFRVVQDERWKLVYHPEVAGKRPIPRQSAVYDLASDPGEEHDVSGPQQGELRRLWKTLSGWMKGEWIRMPRREISARSRESEATLRALGYIQ